MLRLSCANTNKVKHEAGCSFWTVICNDWLAWDRLDLLLNENQFADIKAGVLHSYDLVRIHYVKRDHGDVRATLH